MHQATGRQLPEARHPFVHGMVVFDVVALEVFVALPPEVEPDDAQPDVVLRAFDDDEAIACQAAGLVNQGRGGRPAGIVKHRVVQRRQDAVERVLLAHDGSSLFFLRREEPARKRSYGSRGFTVPAVRGAPPSDTRFQARCSPSSPLCPQGSGEYVLTCRSSRAVFLPLRVGNICH